MQKLIANKIKRLGNAFRRRNRDHYARAEAKALLRVIRILRGD